MRTRIGQHKRHGGSITVEFTAAFAIMLLIFSLVISTLHETGKTNRAQWARQQCLRGANAQLDSFTAVGRAIDEATWRRLWPNTQCRIRQTPGEGDWQGLTRVEVVVRRHINGRDFEAAASRYIVLKETD
jgi:hypothetical protein